MTTPKHTPKRSLGQNFLINQGIIRRIIDESHLTKDDTVLEIGPGRGAITPLLAEKAGRVIAVETDRQLAALLAEKYIDTNITVIHDDILRYPFSALPAGKLKLVSNLPYNIATPIIEKAVTHREQFSELFCMVQLEYGKRLAAKPNTDDYGSLSCFVQYYCDVEILFKISPGSFRPTPKVHSCFVRLTILPTPRIAVRDEGLLFRVIRQGFSQRRKTLANALESLLPKEELQSLMTTCKLPLTTRAENVSLAQFAAIADHIRNA